jgi:hypothetical protein
MKYPRTSLSFDVCHKQDLLQVPQGGVCVWGEFQADDWWRRTERVSSGTEITVRPYPSVVLP